MPGSYIYSLLSKCMITPESKDQVIELIERVLAVAYLGTREKGEEEEDGRLGGRGGEKEEW
jgi:hypothetical protein